MLRRVLFASALLAAVAVARGAVAEDDVEATSPGRPPFSVRDTNAARYALEGAQAALEAGDVARGVRELQRLLDHYPDDLVLLGEDARQTRWIPAPEAARRALEAARPEVRRAYEEIAAPQAEPELARAVAERDERALADVASRYGACSVGVAAARLLAEACYEAGRPQDAAAAAERGLRFARGDAGLWLRRIDALAAAGDAAALAALAPPDGLPAAQTAAGPVSVAERLAEARARTKPPAESSEWPTVGGDASHDRLFPADHELRPLRWTAGEHLRKREGDDAASIGRGDDNQPLFEYRWSIATPLLPAMRDRVLYVADGAGVAAFDLLSGRRRWTFPAGGTAPPGLSLVFPGQGPLRGRTNLDVLHAPTVEGGTVFANVEVSYPYVPRRLNFVEITTYLPRRHLVALDAATGALRWRMGEHPDDRARLKDVSIASPPVVSDGIVAAVGVRYADNKSFSVSLLAFDAATGRLRWMRDELIVGQQELNLFGEPVKELFAGVPAVRDGTMYASTGLGVLLAADVRSGEVRWMSTYDALPIERVQLWWATPLRFALWGPSPIVAHGDAVLAAPPDAASLSCFDRADGRLRWRVPAEASRAGAFLEHFLGVARDTKREVAITSGRRVRAFDLASGRAAWHADLSEGERALGRGGLTKTAVYVPTGQGLARFSIPGEGRYLEPAPWPDSAEPGNLLLLPQVLVVAGRGDWSSEDAPPVLAFFAWEDIERSIAERRAKQPAEPALALEAADLWRVVGRGDRAEAVYEEALRLAEAAGAPDLAARARSGLALVHRDRGDAALAGKRPADAQAEYEAALERAQGPAERVDLRLRLERALAERGLESARVRNLEALASEAGAERATFDPRDGPVSARVGARLRLAGIHRDAGRAADAVDVLQRVLGEDAAERVGDEDARTRARREIEEILVEVGRSAYRRHDEEANALLEKAAQRRDAGLYRRVLDEYPNAAAVPEALVGLADRRIEEGAPNEAAATLRGLLAAYPEHALAPRALAGLAKALAAAGSPVAARAALASLERRHGDASITIDGKTVPATAFASSLRATLGPPKPPAAQGPLSRAAKPALTMEVDAPPPGAQTIPVARDGSATTVPPLLVDTGSDLVAIDPKSVRVRWRKHLSSPTRAALVGDILVVGVADGVIALDPETGDERWRKEVPGTPVALQAGLGQAIVLVREEGVLPRHRLFALDAFTSHEIWRQDLPANDPVAIEPLHVGEEGIVVARRRRDRAMWSPSLAIHSLLTGAPLAEVPCPTDGTMEPQYALAADGRTLLVACREERQTRLEGWDVGTGKRRFRRALEGVGPRVTQLLSFADEAIVLDGSGRIATYALADGEPRHLTGIAGGLDPLFGSSVLVDEKRITMLVRERSSSTLASFDRETGKAAWTVPFALRVNAGALLRSGDVFVVVIAPQSPRAFQAPVDYRVHLVGADGKPAQEMWSTGVGGFRPVPVIEDGTLVLAGVEGVAAWR